LLWSQCQQSSPREFNASQPPILFPFVMMAWCTYFVFFLALGQVFDTSPIFFQTHPSLPFFPHFSFPLDRVFKRNQSLGEPVFFLFFFRGNFPRSRSPSIKFLFSPLRSSGTPVLPLVFFFFFKPGPRFLATSGEQRALDSPVFYIYVHPPARGPFLLFSPIKSQGFSLPLYSTQKEPNPPLRFHRPP